jgi:MFS family permease
MLHHSPSHHFEHQRYFKHKQLDSIYLSIFIKLFGESFISIFTAIYLIDKGFSLAQVGVFYLIYFSMLVAALPLTRVSLELIGVKKTIGIGTLILAVYYYFLRQIGVSVPLEVVAMIYGIGAGFYFTAFNVELVKALRSNKNEGTRIAILRSISILAGIVGPFIGALFITKLSFNLLFGIVAVILLVSLIPLFKTGDRKLSLQPLSIRDLLTHATKRRIVVYSFNGAVQVGLDILWPAFIYLNYKNFITVGGIISLTSLVMTIFIYLVGKYADKNQIKSYKIGVFAHAPTWALRLLLLTPGGLLISNIAGSATAYMIDIPFSRAAIHSAKTSDSPVDFFIFKEIATWIGRFVILAVAIYAQNLTLIFWIIAFVTCAHILLLPEIRRQSAE